MNLHIFPDADEPGERLYLQLKDLLPQLVRHQLPKGCKDFSEYYIRIGERAASPLIPRGNADILIAFEPAEAVRNLSYLKKDGVVIVNSTPVKPTTEALQETGYDGTGYKSNGTNFNNYFGRIYQARYLAGIAAGLKTTSNKIGYVSAYGTELAETCSGINAFALGVQAVNPDATVYVKTLSSWFDPANETAYAEALIEMGCDVIAQHCDTANPQVAAQNAGVFGCGYNSDMTAQAPDAHLVAPIWHWDVYYTAAVQAVIDGTWAELGNYYAGMEVGLVGVSPVSKNCDEKTQGYIDAVTELIKNGEWDVFSGVALSFDENGNVVKTDSPLTDNTGAAVAPVDDATITGTMNYFVKGVELA